jgi:hypothetical protein
MKKIQLFLPSFAVIFGLVILLISLLVSEPTLSFKSQSQLSQRCFYLGEEILPDHLVYPLLMVADRLRLELASPVKQPQIQLEYAWQRLESSRQLMKKDRPQLALKTLEKSQLYWLAAQRQIEQLETPTGSTAAQLQPQLEAEASAYLEALVELRTEFDQPQERDVLDKLITECQTS